MRSKVGFRGLNLHQVLLALSLHPPQALPALCRSLCLRLTLHTPWSWFCPWAGASFAEGQSGHASQWAGSGPGALVGRGGGREPPSSRGLVGRKPVLPLDCPKSPESPSLLGRARLSRSPCHVPEGGWVGVHVHRETSKRLQPVNRFMEMISNYSI